MTTVKELLDTITTQCKIITELSKINERLNVTVDANKNYNELNRLYKHMKRSNERLVEENRTLRNLYSSTNLGKEIFMENE